MKEVEIYRNILEKKNNVILQGAPGTGKTYTTARLALSVIGKLPERDGKTNQEYQKLVMDTYSSLQLKFDEDGNVANDGQIGFVTFHQSMDYEDFVEGIKPFTTKVEDLEEDSSEKGEENATMQAESNKSEENSVIFKVKKGIFRAICEKAQKLKSDNFEEIYKNLVDKINEPENEVNIAADGNDPEKINILCGFSTPKVNNNSRGRKGGIEFGVALNRGGNLTICQKKKEKWEKMNTSVTQEALYTVLTGEDVPKTYAGGIAQWMVINGFKEENSSDKKFVLIIDEINRGNVSKILGELISLLEKDKRLLVGNNSTNDFRNTLTVTLPYSNDPFSVPSNLYIIGTMNTTDRSAGSLDYAVRRRFAFITLESQLEKLENYYGSEHSDLKEKACGLFEKVRKFIETYQSDSDMDFADLMIGHSYFMAKDEEELQIKWQYEILPLLIEYSKDGLIKQSPLKQSDKSRMPLSNAGESFQWFLDKNF